MILRQASLKAVVVAAAFGLATPAPAGPAFPVLNRGWNPTSAILQNVAVFGQDDRRTEEEFARENAKSLKEVKQWFAATGLLTCDVGSLTANVTVKNDVIVTSAHAFLDYKTCKKKSTPESCIFHVDNGTTRRDYKVKMMEATGRYCDQGSTSFHWDDWAILRLAEPVQDVRPYILTRASIPFEGMDVISINSINLDLHRDGHKLNDLTKTIGRCRAHARDLIAADSGLAILDCGITNGGSGGPILDPRTNTPSLLAIHRSSSGRPKGVPETGAFDRDRWGQQSVLVTARFYTEILIAAGVLRPVSSVEASYRKMEPATKAMRFSPLTLTSSDAWSGEAASGMTLYDNYDIDGEPISSMSTETVGECSLKCSSVKQCTAFKFKKSDRICTLEKEGEFLRYDGRITSGTRKEVPLPKGSNWAPSMVDILDKLPRNPKIISHVHAQNDCNDVCLGEIACVSSHYDKSADACFNFREFRPAPDDSPQVLLGMKLQAQ